MKNFMRWTSSSILSPMLTVPALFFLIFWISSTLTLGILNSRSVTIGIVFSGALAFPFLLSKLHSVRPMVPYLIWSSSIVLGLTFQPFSYEGNAKLGFLASMDFWFLGAAVISLGVTPFLMMRKLKALRV